MENSKPRGGTRPGAGRPRKTIEEKTARNGKYAFWIDGAHALKLQTLMLRDVPGVRTPDEMLEHLIDNETIMTDEQITAQIKADLMIEDEIAALRDEQARDVSDFRKEQINQQVDRMNDTIIKNAAKMSESDRASYLEVRRERYRR